MSDVDPSGAREVLIGHLQADFTPTAELEAAVDPEASALSQFLAVTRVRDVREDIEGRLASAENQQLGSEVLDLLQAAPITESFKDFIAGAVRTAHAQQSRVGAEVAPEALGLSGEGRGIYDPGEAQEIEARSLRAYLHDIFYHYFIKLPEEVAPKWTEEIYVGLNPVGRIALAAFEVWRTDYRDTHGKDPLEGLDEEAFLLAVPRPEMLPGIDSVLPDEFD